MIALKTRTLGILTVAIMLGGIALSAGLGLWKTTATKEPAKIRSGEFSGMPNPSDIRGSYTWADVAKAFGLPEASLVKAFGASGADEKVSSLEGLYAGKLPEGVEIGTDSVRLFVALYTGLPLEAGEETALPKSAIRVLRAEGKADSLRLDAAEKNAVETGTASAAGGGAVLPTASSPEASGAEHVPVAGQITGKATFNDLVTWGFDMKKVEEICGGLGPSSQSLKDYCAAKGLSFSEVKAKLEGLAPK